MLFVARNVTSEWTVLCFGRQYRVRITRKHNLALAAVRIIRNRQAQSDLQTKEAIKGEMSTKSVEALTGAKETKEVEAKRTLKALER